MTRMAQTSMMDLFSAPIVTSVVEAAVAAAPPPPPPETVEVRRFFWVVADKAPDLLKRIAKLNRKAERFGLGAIVCRDLGTRACCRVEKRIVDLHEYEVFGEAPRIPGWRFAGTLQHVEGANILRAIIDGVPVAYRTARPWCVHCRVDRGWKDTYLIVSDENEWRQVGKACLRDFTGHDSPEALAAMAEWIASALDAAAAAEESEGGGGGGRNRWDLVHYLACVWDAIQENGWVSRKSADAVTGRMATSDLAFNMMEPPPASGRKPHSPSPEARAAAEAAVAWADELPDDVSDYLWNVRTVARLGVVEWRTFGIAASIVTAHDRDLARARETARAATVSQHFGTVGKRGEYTLTVDRIIPLEDTGYGVSHLVIMVDAAGNRAVWKQSAGSSADLEAGSTYRAKATVRRHGEYRGVAQTDLTRLAVVEDLTPPPAEVPGYLVGELEAKADLDAWNAEEGARLAAIDRAANAG